MYRTAEMTFAHFPAAEDRLAEIQKYNEEYII